MGATDILYQNLLLKLLKLHLKCYNWDRVQFNWPVDPDISPISSPNVYRLLSWCVIGNASVTSHSQALYGLFLGCFKQKSYVHSWWRHTNFASSYSFSACIIRLWAPYRLRDRKQPVNSPCGDRMGSTWPNTMPMWDFCQFWLCQFPYMSKRVPYGTLAGHTQALNGSHRIWKTLKIPLWGPYDVLWIIQPNHKYSIVSSCTGPIAWCDHDNSTDVKFLRPLHSALQARNRTGDKNSTGPVVGCDWGIRHHGCSQTGCEMM